MRIKHIKLPFVDSLKSKLKSNTPFIQVVLGPRQVGKTTGLIGMLEDDFLKGDSLYCSTDEELSPTHEWIELNWQKAKEIGNNTILVIDEIQKIEQWSSVIKKLWDQQKIQGGNQKLVLLGSSSLKIQQGLVESLAGRYELHKVHHWNAQESNDAYNISLEQFLLFGGYPGSYPLISNVDQWVNYIKFSIIDAVIGKDILAHAKVKSPAIFKQCFELINSYPAQEISYTKLLGNLQGKGHVDQIKYYLQLFEEAFLIISLQKYSRKEVLKRTSSPKILPLCPAFFTAMKYGELSSQEKGRLFEVCVGSILNRMNGNLYYWREGNDEVDFVFERGRSLYAIEVKSGQKRSMKGLTKFKNKFPNAKTGFITKENFESFSKGPLNFLEKYFYISEIISPNPTAKE